MHIYRVSQKKRNGGFSVPCELKVLYLFMSLDQTSSAEEVDTKIIKCGWVVLILCPFLEIRSFSNFAQFLRPMSEEFSLSHIDDIGRYQLSISIFYFKVPGCVGRVTSASAVRCICMYVDGANIG